MKLIYPKNLKLQGFCSVRILFSSLIILISLSLHGQNTDCMTEAFETQTINNSNNTCDPDPNYSYSTDPSFLNTFPKKNN